MLWHAQGAAKSVGQLVNNQTTSAQLYSLLTAALAGVGTAYLFAPHSTLSVRGLAGAARPAMLAGSALLSSVKILSSWSQGRVTK